MIEKARKNRCNGTRDSTLKGYLWIRRRPALLVFEVPSEALLITS